MKSMVSVSMWWMSGMCLSKEVTEVGRWSLGALMRVRTGLSKIVVTVWLVDRLVDFRSALITLSK